MLKNGKQALLGFGEDAAAVVELLEEERLVDLVQLRHHRVVGSPQHGKIRVLVTQPLVGA